jgi:uncharacterized protein (DUF2147 family)
MKIVFDFFLISIISLSSVAQANPDAILGKWISVEGNLKVEVYKENNDFKAKLIWFDDSDDKSKPMNARTDEKNPDKALRSRKLIGIDVLRNLKYYPHDDEWDDGKIYDSSSGKEWSSEIWITKKGLLKVKGYWLFKFISQTETFKRP